MHMCILCTYYMCNIHIQRFIFLAPDLCALCVFAQFWPLIRLLGSLKAATTSGRGMVVLRIGTPVMIKHGIQTTRNSHLQHSFRWIGGKYRNQLYLAERKQHGFL